MHKIEIPCKLKYPIRQAGTYRWDLTRCLKG